MSGSLTNWSSNDPGKQQHALLCYDRLGELMKALIEVDQCPPEVVVVVLLQQAAAIVLTTDTLSESDWVLVAQHHWRLVAQLVREGGPEEKS